MLSSASFHILTPSVQAEGKPNQQEVWREILQVAIVVDCVRGVDQCAWRVWRNDACAHCSVDCGFDRNLCDSRDAAAHRDLHAAAAYGNLYAVPADYGSSRSDGRAGRTLHADEQRLRRG